MKQTAVEWLFEQVNDFDWKNLIGEKKIEIFEQAKQIEKEQQIALLKFSREMCTLDASIDYIINEFNKYGK